MSDVIIAPANLASDPAVEAIAARVGTNRWAVAGCLVELWGVVAESYPNGFIPPDAEDVYQLAKSWPGQMGAMLGNLIEFGFLIPADDGYLVADWDTLTGRLIRRREKTAAAVRRFRHARADDSPAFSSSRPAVSKQTPLRLVMPPVTKPKREEPMPDKKPGPEPQASLFDGTQALQPAPMAMAVPTPEYEQSFWRAVGESIAPKHIPQRDVKAWKQICVEFFQVAPDLRDPKRLMDIYLTRSRLREASGQRPYQFTPTALHNNLSGWLLKDLQKQKAQENAHERPAGPDSAHPGATNSRQIQRDDGEWTPDSAEFDDHDYPRPSRQQRPAFDWRVSDV